MTVAIKAFVKLLIVAFGLAVAYSLFDKMAHGMGWPF